MELMMQTAEQTAAHTPGLCRVVKRHDLGNNGRIWDVFCDDIGDYLATMNPTLPVSSRDVAQRICDSVNARRAAAKAEGR